MGRSAQSCVVKRSLEVGRVGDRRDLGRGRRARADRLARVIDIKLVRDEPDRVRASQQARGEDPGIVDAILAADERRRSSLGEFEALRAEQKTVSKSVGAAMGAFQKAKKAGAADADHLEKVAHEARAHAGTLSEQVKSLESDADEAGAELERLLRRVGNVIIDGVPVGGEDDYVVLETVGAPRDFAAEGFEPLDHLALGERLGAIDMERGAKVGGARFYYLTGVGALLELALVNMAMAQATAAGFTAMITPALVRPAAMDGTGFLGQAAENVYYLADDDRYLVGTSEVPLAAYHMDEILDAERLPLRYAGFSSCFRREAGTYGKDTRGIIRVHQFEKVEMFVFTAPEDAEAEHRRLLQWEKDFLNALELPYRVIDVASGDLGASAARKFDIEAWVPTQGKYREVTSTSNTTEYQARRLSIRVREEGNK